MTTVATLKADDQALVAYSRGVIQRGSRSFAVAATLFDEHTRESAYLLYAWCRHCDDQADGQVLGRDVQALAPAERRERIDRLYQQTRLALEGGRAGEPVYRALAVVSRRHGLPPALAYDHLAGFRQDADGMRPAGLGELLAYCYAVAGAVGVMMAWIMGVRDERVLDRASDLGIAFQLTNIARDVVEDAAVGRVYLPAAWLAEAGLDEAALTDPARRGDVHALAVRLVREAEPYYRSARWGMARLPFRSAWAVGAARGVYREIGRKLVREGPDAWDGRLSTSRGEKLNQVFRGFGAALWAASVDQLRPADDRTGLWNRPHRGSAPDGREDALAFEPGQRQQAV